MRSQYVKFKAILLIGCFSLLGAKPSPAQSPFQALVDWKDGVLADGVGPANATNNPQDLRFWIGHGLRRGQINIGTRARQFDEEGGPDQNYLSSIRELEFDEGAAGSLDDRLFVLTGLQKKASPPVLAQIQYLTVEFPSNPGVLLGATIQPPFGITNDYDVLSIEVIPEQKLLLAIGNVVNPLTGSPVQVLVQLYRYGVTTPGGPDELVLLEELAQAPLALKDCPNSNLTDRKVLKFFECETYKLGGTWHAFIEAGMPKEEPSPDFPTKPFSRGIVVCKVDPTAPLGSRLAFYPQNTAQAAPNFIYDPAWDWECGLQSACTPPDPLSPADITVNAIDFVDEQSPGSNRELIYMACGRKSQVQEFEIGAYTTNGFTNQRKLDLLVLQPGQSGVEDNLFEITTRHDLPNQVDLLYVVGQQFLHVASRRPPTTLTHPCGTVMEPTQGIPAWKPYRAVLQQFFGGTGDTRGQVMLEKVTLAQATEGEPPETGDREHYWVLTPDTAFPWSIFDMTDRDLHPAVEPPGVVARRYAPGGTDGALIRWEWDALYHTNFGGLVKYDLLKTIAMPFNPSTFDVQIQPDYDSYSPAVVVNPNSPGSFYEYATEQLDSVEVALLDSRIVSVNGRGRAVEWKLDPVSHDPAKALDDPSGVRLIPPAELAGVSGVTSSSDPTVQLNALWSKGLATPVVLDSYLDAYSRNIVTGRGVHSGRPFVIVDLALTGDPSCTSTEPDELPLVTDRLLIGRYWYEWTEATPGGPIVHPEAWQVLDLSSAGDPGLILEPLMGDFSISPGQGHLLVAANGGVLLVGMYGADTEESDPFIDEQNWVVRDRLVTHACGLPGVDPFGTGVTYREVLGVDWVGSELIALNVGEPHVGPNKGKGGALAVFKFAHHAGATFGDLKHLFEDRAAIPGVTGFPAVDQIPGTDFYRGNAIRSFETVAGVYRLYATSHESGAVVEFELVHDLPGSMTHQGTWNSGTHFTETPDCIPYDVGHPGGLPLVLIPRFQQTVALLLGKGFKSFPVGP